MANDLKVIDTGDVEERELDQETGMIQDVLLLMLNYGEALPYTANTTILPITAMLTGRSNTPTPGEVAFVFNSSMPALNALMKQIYSDYETIQLADVTILSKDAIELSFEIVRNNATPVLVTRTFTFGTTND